MSRDFRNRKQIRLKGYDYSQQGAYFVTICTWNREYLFGEVIDGEMVLNDCGRIVQEEWLKSSKIRDEVLLGEYVIMPNHVHGIIILTVGATRWVAHDVRDILNFREIQTNGRATQIEGRATQIEGRATQIEGRATQIEGRATQIEGRATHRVAPTIAGSIGAIIGQFKSIATKRIKLHRTSCLTIWQRGYHDHIIRNDAEYERICNYIKLNPENWLSDVNKNINMNYSRVWPSTELGRSPPE